MRRFVIPRPLLRAQGYSPGDLIGHGCVLVGEVTGATWLVTVHGRWFAVLQEFGLENRTMVDIDRLPGGRLTLAPMEPKLAADAWMQRRLLWLSAIVGLREMEQAEAPPWEEPQWPI